MDPIRASDGETRDLYVDPYARPCRAQEDPSVLSGRALCCPRARAPFGDTADGDGHRAAGRRAGVPAESGAPEDVSEPGLRRPPLPGPPSSPGRGGVGWGLHLESGKTRGRKSKTVQISNTLCTAYTDCGNVPDTPTVAPPGASQNFAPSLEGTQVMCPGSCLVQYTVASLAQPVSYQPLLPTLFLIPTDPC